jgi:hypothetical protein
MAPATAAAESTAVEVPAKKIAKNIDCVTTLAIRNLLFSLTLQDLLEALDEAGYANTYDFVYLPRKVKEHKNLGFAFVNFVNSEVASRFSAEWHRSHHLRVGSSRQPLNISAADVQGRPANEKLASSHKVCQARNTFLRPS